MAFLAKRHLTLVNVQVDLKRSIIEISSNVLEGGESMDKVNIGQAITEGFNRFFEFLPQLIGALVLLIVGYLVAKVLQFAIQRGLERMRFDKAMYRSHAGEYISRVVSGPSRFLGRVAYWVIFLFFVSLAANALNLPALNDILTNIYNYIPRIIAAIIIFLVASAIAAGAVTFSQRVLGATASAKLLAAVIPFVTLSIAAFMILNQLGIATDIVNILFTAIVGSVALGMALAFGLGGRDVARDLLEQAYAAGRRNAVQAKADMAEARDNAKETVEKVKRNARR